MKQRKSIDIGTKVRLSKMSVKRNLGLISLALHLIISQVLSSQDFDYDDSTQYLDRNLARSACRENRGCARSDRFNDIHLRYCSRYKFNSLWSDEDFDIIMHRPFDACVRLVERFIQLDEKINRYDHNFTSLLTRYNCHNGYSVKWNCEDCKKVYKDWLCATHLSYYVRGTRVKPCISFCERVEQRCPYLHPITKEQYGGQPVFICRDPNIPFVPEITPEIPYSEPNLCYDLCHISNNETEIRTDSLSKYTFGNCPGAAEIASRCSMRS